MLTQAGTPAEQVLVQPRSLDDPPQPVPELAVFSGVDGQYRWTLAPGRYEFVAGTGAPVAVTVLAGKTVRVDLRS